MASVTCHIPCDTNVTLGEPLLVGLVTLSYESCASLYNKKTYIVKMKIDVTV